MVRMLLCWLPALSVATTVMVLAPTFRVSATLKEPSGFSEELLSKWLLS
jgi:hypothetical protein